MKFIWRKTWLLIVASAAIFFAVIGVSIPLLLYRDNANVALTDLAVFAADPDSFALSDPVVLQDKPRITIKRGTVSLPKSDNGSGGGEPAASSTDIVDTSILALKNAVIEISVGADDLAPASAHQAVAPLAEVLATLNFAKLGLENTTVIVDAGNAGTHRLRSVRGTIHLKPGKSLHAKGEFLYRGKEITFDTTLNLKSGQEDQVGIPLKASFKSDLFVAQMHGQLTVRERLQLIADNADVALKSIGDVAAWLGIAWESGPKLENFKAVGKLIWSRQSISFHNSKFAFGANQANGTLSVNRRDSRPMIEGTLAFQSLDVTDYLSESKPDDTFPFSKPIAWLREFGLGPDNGVLALIDKINADLRISTGRAVAGSSVSGPGSATLSLKDGKLLADLTETLPETGSTGNVQVSLDVTGHEPLYSIRGKLQRLDVGHLTRFAFGNPVLSGPGVVTIDIRGRGATRDAFTRSISGKANVKMMDEASLALDLKRLFQQKRQGDSERGWGAALKGKTKLRGVNASMIFSNGTAQTKLMRAKLNDKTVSVAGTIKIPSRSIDLRVSVGREEPGARVDSDGAAKVEILHVTGDWGAPNVTSTQRASSDNPEAVRPEPQNHGGASRG